MVLSGNILANSWLISTLKLQERWLCTVCMAQMISLVKTLSFSTKAPIGLGSVIDLHASFGGSSLVNETGDVDGLPFAVSECCVSVFKDEVGSSEMSLASWLLSALCVVYQNRKTRVAHSLSWYVPGFSWDAYAFCHLFGSSQHFVPCFSARNCSCRAYIVSLFDWRNLK